MSFTKADLHRIFDRASTLGERLSGDFVPIEDDGVLGRVRLARWRQLTVGDDPHKFSGILQTWKQEPICEPKLLKLLGAVERLPDTPLPSWLQMLHQIAAAANDVPPNRQFSAEEKRQRTRISRRVPYAHAYWPIVDLAWTRATEGLVNSNALLKCEASNGLKQHLLERISGVASPILHSSFLARKSYAHSGLAGCFSGSQPCIDAPGSPIYDAFVSEQMRTGLNALLIRFPVAARLIAVVTQQWINFVRQFLQRLETDWKTLAENFDSRFPLGRVLSIKAGVSDPHQDGQSVLIASFQNGQRLVYKPRSMAVDDSFFKLVATLNQQTTGLHLQTVKIIDKDEYGWMDFVQQQPCLSRRAAGRFYQRAGALTYLVHWLRGIDFHRENVVASGEHPVLIDLECLAHPFRAEGLAIVDVESGEPLEKSIFRTGLLPLLQMRPAGSNWFDGSGFGASIRQKSVLRTPHWKQINTDQMALHYSKLWRFHSAHRVRLNKRLTSITKFGNAFIYGYKQTAKALEGPDSTSYSHWQDIIQQTTRRYVIRPTAIYGVLLTHSLQASVLAHGVDRSIELEALPCDESSPNIRRAEISSLEQMDIPYLTVGSGCPSQQTAIDLVQRRTNLASEVKTIRLSLSRRLRLKLDRIVSRKSGSNDLLASNPSNSTQTNG